MVAGPLLLQRIPVGFWFLELLRAGALFVVAMKVTGPSRAPPIPDMCTQGKQGCPSNNNAKHCMHCKKSSEL